MTITIAIANQKGGVGKTTTCLSLGACLAEIGHRVLLVDLDPQSHLTMSLGIEPEKQRRTVSDVLLADSSLVSVSCTSDIPGMEIVPANQGLAIIDKLLYARNGYEFHLRRKPKGLRADLFDFVLIDCPPFFGTLMLNALTAADLLVIPVQCEYYAAQALRRIVGLAKLVQEKTNRRLRYQMLVTLYDRRNRISRVMLDQMRHELNHLLFETIIEVDTKLRESSTFGQPITMYAPQTRGARQYRALAKELTTYER